MLQSGANLCQGEKCSSKSFSKQKLRYKIEEFCESEKHFNHAEEIFDHSFLFVNFLSRRV